MNSLNFNHVKASIKTNKPPRANKKTWEFREKIESFYKKHFPSMNPLQIKQVQRIENELLSQYKIEQIDDSVLQDYFTLKLNFPRTIYSAELLQTAIAIVENMLRTTADFIAAETIYKYVQNRIKSVPDSVFYYWFSRLGKPFSVHGVYSPDICTLIVYLALVRERYGK
ncbi:hypothetical protein [Nostoc phage N1]|nr:hypothetical protein [Nostoc phage N1]